MLVKMSVIDAGIFQIKTWKPLLSPKVTVVSGTAPISSKTSETVL